MAPSVGYPSVEDVTDGAGIRCDSTSRVVYNGYDEH